MDEVPEQSESEEEQERLYEGWTAPEAVPFVASQEGWSVPKMFVEIRDRGLSDWSSICHAFGVDPQSKDTLRNRLRDVLSLLRAAGLLEYDEPKNYYDQIQGPIKVSRRVPFIQSALNLSISALARVVSGRTILATPPFDFTQPSAEGDLFVLMPFRVEFDEVYGDVIKGVAKKLNLTVARADELFGAKSIVNDIWSAILRAKVVIADCTGRNPNVFYEIGLAHAIGKIVILIAQNDDDVPFDLRHLRYIKYTLTPRGAKALANDLRQTIEASIENTENA